MKPRGLDRVLKYAVPADLKNWQAFVAKNLHERTRKEQALKESSDPEGSARKDFFHYLFNARDPETGKQGYDLGELWGECELLTIAGSDTTAIVTAAMTFYLARNPPIQAKLLERFSVLSHHTTRSLLGPSYTDASTFEPLSKRHSA